MATRKTATKATAKIVVENKKYVVLNGGFDQCYCSEVHDNIKTATSDAVKHYNDGSDDVIYVVEIVKTIARGKPAVHEGYINTDEDNKLDNIIVEVA